jgi:hypothetical protein
MQASHKIADQLYKEKQQQQQQAGAGATGPEAQQAAADNNAQKDSTIDTEAQEG